MSAEHHYLSTACHHEQHGLCRFQCKHCAAQCSCSCHSEIERSTKSIRTYQQLVEALAELQREKESLTQQLADSKTMQLAWRIKAQALEKALAVTATYVKRFTQMIEHQPDCDYWCHGDCSCGCKAAIESSRQHFEDTQKLLAIPQAVEPQP